MPSIAGKYEMLKSEDMEPHLVAYGLSYLVRKMAGAVSPPMEITIEGDKVTIKIATPVASKETVFTFGEEYEETLPGDIIMKSVTKKVNDHEMLTESVSPKSGLKASRHYLFTDDGCVVTTNTDGVAKPGIRQYKRSQ